MTIPAHREVAQLAGTPLAARSHDLALAAASGRIGSVLSQVPAAERGLIETAARTALRRRPQPDPLDRRALLTFLAAILSFLSSERRTS